MEKFAIPPEEQARLLFEDFDGHYFSFAGGLPQPLQAMARQKKTYLGQEVDGAFEGFSSINPLYTCTPWMLWELFSDLPAEDFIQLAVSAGFLSLASILMDHVVDDQVRDIGQTMLLHHALYTKALGGLRESHDKASRFWSHFDRLTEIYLQGLSMEADLQTARTEFDRSKFDRIAASKVAPIMITIASFCTASDREEYIPQIESSLNCISMAGQMLDDALDWEQDQKDGHMTYLLAEASAEYGKRSASSEVSFGDHMKNSPFLNYAIGEAIRLFDQAEVEMGELQCAGWQNYIDYYRNIAVEENKRRISQVVLQKIEALAEGL